MEKKKQEVKVLRTNNGGEYISSRFKEFLKSEGIQHELTIPKNTEQNGVAERMYRTLVETVCAMLVYSKLPQKLWGEAFSTAVYLRNRSPTKAGSGMTPYEMWTKESQMLDTFVFLGVTPLHLFPKMKEGKLIPKQECIYCI